MKRSAQYRNGFRAASKRAVELLHARAENMNDPRARQILNGAAWDLGVALKAEAELSADNEETKDRDA